MNAAYQDCSDQIESLWLLLGCCNAMVGLLRLLWMEEIHLETIEGNYETSNGIMG